MEKQILPIGATIQITGKLYLDKYNNTYHVSKVCVNGDLVGISNKTYGYDNQFIYTGLNILWQYYTVPNWLEESCWIRDVERMGYKIEDHKINVSKERDLKF